MRNGIVERNTAETQIRINLELDGSGVFQGTTGIGFFDHMLHLLASHGHFDLTIRAVGDLAVDTHHTVEDVAITLGEALREALGDKRGIARYGLFYCPMDEALTRCVVDLSGRPYLVYDAKIPVERLGTLETEMIREFMYALSVHGMMNLHLTNLYGTNGHHIVESMFKALGRALRAAVRIEDVNGGVPSTKGSL